MLIANTIKSSFWVLTDTKPLTGKANLQKRSLDRNILKSKKIEEKEDPNPNPPNTEIKRGECQEAFTNYMFLPNTNYKEQNLMQHTLQAPTRERTETQLKFGIKALNERNKASAFTTQICGGRSLLASEVSPIG